MENNQLKGRRLTFVDSPTAFKNAINNGINHNVTNSGLDHIMGGLENMDNNDPGKATISNVPRRREMNEDQQEMNHILDNNNYFNEEDDMFCTPSNDNVILSSAQKVKDGHMGG